MWRWLIIIARDRPELWATWTCFYGGVENLDVLVDRRQGQLRTGTQGRPDRRSRPDRETELYERGFLVISQPRVLGVLR